MYHEITFLDKNFVLSFACEESLKHLSYADSIMEQWLNPLARHR